MNTELQNLNDYFDKVYVLSLPRLKDRIEHVNKELEGLDFDFFWGTDKSTVNLNELIDQKIYSPELFRSFYKKPKEILMGVLSCALGHVNIYKDIIDNNYKKCLILEDDCLLLRENMHLFPKIMSQLPDNWELLYLGYEKNEEYGLSQKVKRLYYRLLKSHATLKMSRSMFKFYYPKKLSEHIASAGFHDCTHAYAVTLEGAKKLLDQNTPLYLSSDNLLAYLVTNQKIKGFISKPKLFSQLTAFDSTFKSMTSDKEIPELGEG